MGDSIKKLTDHRNTSLRNANALNPHTWLMGQKKSARYDLVGQAVGAYDDKYYQPEQQPAIPYTDPTAPAAVSRDRQRRMARLAQGLASTIHAGSLAVPVDTAPKSLLGS